MLDPGRWSQCHHLQHLGAEGEQLTDLGQTSGLGGSKITLQGGEGTRETGEEGRGGKGRGREGEKKARGGEDVVIRCRCQHGATTPGKEAAGAGSVTHFELMMETVVFFPSSPVTMGTSKKSLFIQLSRVDVNRSLSLQGGGEGGGEGRSGGGAGERMGRRRICYIRNGTTQYTQCTYTLRSHRGLLQTGL